MKFVIACFLLISTFGQMFSEFNYHYEIDKIIRKFIREFESQQVYLSGIGGGRRGEINDINLSLECYQNLNLKQARELYLNLLSNIINKINCHSELRPYLHNYPFTYPDVDLMLSFNYDDCQWISRKHVALIFMVKKKDIIVYKTYQKETDKFILINSENITEALQDYSAKILQK